MRRHSHPVLMRLINQDAHFLWGGLLYFYANNTGLLPDIHFLADLRLGNIVGPTNTFVCRHFDTVLAAKRTKIRA